jgi:hypothetical protein
MGVALMCRSRNRQHRRTVQQRRFTRVGATGQIFLLMTWRATVPSLMPRISRFHGAVNNDDAITRRR